MPRYKKQHNFGIIEAIFIAIVLICVLVLVQKTIILVENGILEPQKIEPYAQIYNYFSGSDKPKRTLVLFANNAEARNGGGFLGSYAILEGQSGKLKMSKVQNIYNIDTPGVNNIIARPMPFFMQRLIPNNSLRDSGNSINWPDNARDAIYFYEKQTGDTVDGVVQITPNVLLDLLRKTGPIELKDYSMVVTPENFLETVQLEVESGKDKAEGRDPKSGILTQLADRVISKLLSKNIIELTEYTEFFRDQVDRKNIVLYSKDEQIQKNIEQVGGAGLLKSFTGNNFTMFEANIGADKSSPFINRNVDIVQTEESKGVYIVDLTIKREHTSEIRLPYVNPYTGKSDFLIKTNYSFVQMVLPDKAKLISTTVPTTEWYDMSRDGHTVFGYWSIVPPLKSQEISIRYSIADTINYSFDKSISTLFAKQVGGWPYNVKYTIVPQGKPQLVATSQESNVEVGLNSVVLRATIDKDTVLSALYEPKIIKK